MSKASVTTERETFRDLFAASEKDIYRYVSAFVPNLNDSQDIVQQTAVILWEKFEQYDPARPFTPWACRFARNVALNWLSRNARWKTLVDSGLPDILAAKQAQMQTEFDERLPYLSKCLAQLPEEHKHMIENYYNEKDVEELAQKGNRSVDAIYKSLQRIRKRLKVCIDGHLKAQTLDRI